MNQYGQILIIAGVFFLIAGLYNFIILKRHRSKYPSEAWATISSCRKYTLKLGSDTHIYHALILDFVADDNKDYKVRKDIGKISMPYDSPNSKPYSVGEKVRIYYNPENPNKINIEKKNSYKMVVILSCVFICIGLVSLLIGSYLTFYYK